jgi:hypothetical protein
MFTLPGVNASNSAPMIAVSLILSAELPRMTALWCLGCEANG